uniref:Uncharacterized protein n=1 Tax=Tanacetum cinerariifolium TaxID=118510 RepID=A0A6L2KLC1_TANCI|nr:hypothetical protein [Tanacetum cinerariifolium]
MVETRWWGGCGGRGVGDGGVWRGMAHVVDGDNDDDFVEMMVRVAIMKCGVVCRGRGLVTPNPLSPRVLHMYSSMVSIIVHATSSLKCSSISNLGELDSSRLGVLKSFLDERNSRSGFSKEFEKGSIRRIGRCEIRRIGDFLDDFAGFVRNYNMHNMGKKMGELHALLIEYVKGLPKKAATSQVMVIQGGRIQKANKKSLNAKGKDNCHYAPTITRGVVSVSRLVDNGFIQCFTNYEILVSKNNVLYFNAILGDGIYEIDMLNLMPNVHSNYNDSYFIAFIDDYSRYGYVYLLKHKHKVFETFKLTPPYTPQHNGVSERRNRTLLDMVDKTPYELRYEKVPNFSYLKVWGCETLVKRDTTEKLQHRSNKCIFIGYPKETLGYYFYFPPKNKIVVARYAEFLEKNLISQKVSGRVIELEEIQDEDTSPSENTSKITMEVEGFEPPQKEVVPIRRSARTRRAPDRLCLNVEVEEYSLEDLNEPTNYKAGLLDPESDKWVDAMNAKMQSMKDNQVWLLVDLPANLEKGYTQTYKVDYEDTFSPVADIRAIRILIAIAAFYDYEIWQMNVKTALLNGYIDKDIYMVQPEGFVNLTHPRKTGYVFILNGDAVDWKSSKQSTAAMPATEAEYIAASEAAMELFGLGSYFRAWKL